MEPLYKGLLWDRNFRDWLLLEVFMIAIIILVPMNWLLLRSWLFFRGPVVCSGYGRFDMLLH